MYEYGGYEFTLESNGETLNGDSRLQIRSLTLTERILEVPTFVFEYSATSKFLAEEYKEAELVLESDDTGTWSYNLTALSFAPNRISGALIKSDLMFERSSQYLNASLEESIRSLGIRDDVEGCETVESENTFFQYNETKLECAQRLLNMVGYDTYWTISWDKIKVFPITPTNSTSITLGNETAISCNRQKIYDTNFHEVKGETDRYNINFGRYSTCIPRLSEYPLDCVASTNYKRMFRDYVFNTLIIKTYTQEPNLFVGDSVKIQDWVDVTQNLNYVVVGRMVKIGKYSSDYIIEFANMDGWL